MAIRSSNWSLRVASLKQVFSALIGDYYASIIPHHLAEIQCYPSITLHCLKKGGFTVNLTGQRWRAVTLDEVHEMCINKDFKTAVVRPTEAYLQKTSLFFNHHIKVYKNIIQQLFPQRSVGHACSSELLDSSPQAIKYEENITLMCNLIANKASFPTKICSKDWGLLNILTGQTVTHEQTSDCTS